MFFHPHPPKVQIRLPSGLLIRMETSLLFLTLKNQEVEVGENVGEILSRLPLNFKVGLGPVASKFNVSAAIDVVERIVAIAIVKNLIVFFIGVF